MPTPELRFALQHGIDLELNGSFIEAETIYRQVAGFKKAFPDAAYVYGCHQLLMGNYEKAWPLFQYRLKTDFYQRKGTMKLPAPFWDGTPIPDETLLVHVDQGLGDAVLCARFLPWAADRVGKLIFVSHAGFAEFFSGVDPRIEIIQMGDEVPLFHRHVDLFSLPAYFGADEENMPLPPYLAPSPDDAAVWRRRLAGDRPKVGLSWRGNAQNPRGKEKSLEFEEMLPILEVPEIDFYGLQTDMTDAERALLPGHVSFTDLGPEIAAPAAFEARRSFCDTAAAIAGLDLVIGIDSAVAHLTAAMGRPLWIVLYRYPDWRWMTLVDQETDVFRTSPWYPEPKRFRQRERWNWTDVVADLRAALAEASNRG